MEELILELIVELILFSKNVPSVLFMGCRVYRIQTVVKGGELLGELLLGKAEIHLMFKLPLDLRCQLLHPRSRQAGTAVALPALAVASALRSRRV